MAKTSETVVFFGSGPVAAASLEFLAEQFNIEVVVTKPKPAYHRGSFPVLNLSKKLGLPTRTVSNKAELSALIATDPFKSKLGVLVDFGIIVDRNTIDFFGIGIVNSHFSLLPKWRGADPITFAILSGGGETGVSLMLLVEKMDEGPLLAQAPFQIPPGCTTPELTDSLIEVSNQTLALILPKYLAGELQPIPQDGAIESTYSRKLTKDDGLLDWRKPAVQLEREIRAFIDWPKSHTELGGREVIITKAHVIPSQSPDSKPGDVEVIKEAGIIIVTTSNGSLFIEKLKPAGKPEMTAQAFLAGNKL